MLFLSNFCLTEIFVLERCVQFFLGVVVSVEHRPLVYQFSVVGEMEGHWVLLGLGLGFGLGWEVDGVVVVAS